MGGRAAKVTLRLGIVDDRTCSIHRHDVECRAEHFRTDSEAQIQAMPMKARNVKSREEFGAFIARAPSLPSAMSLQRIGPFKDRALITFCTGPCGYYGDPRRACSCAPGAIGRYQKRQSTGVQGKKRDQQPRVSSPRSRVRWGVG